VFASVLCKGQSEVAAGLWLGTRAQRLDLTQEKCNAEKERRNEKKESRKGQGRSVLNGKMERGASVVLSLSLTLSSSNFLLFLFCLSVGQRPSFHRAILCEPQRERSASVDLLFPRGHSSHTTEIGRVSGVRGERRKNEEDRKRSEENRYQIETEGEANRRK
jgi:hypothetical protein